MKDQWSVIRWEYGRLSRNQWLFGDDHYCMAHGAANHSNSIITGLSFRKETGFHVCGFSYYPVDGEWIRGDVKRKHEVVGTNQISNPILLSYRSVSFEQQRSCPVKLRGPPFPPKSTSFPNQIEKNNLK
jgi:hypothetical protein